MYCIHNIISANNYIIRPRTIQVKFRAGPIDSYKKAAYLTQGNNYQ